MKVIATLVAAQAVAASFFAAPVASAIHTVPAGAAEGAAATATSAAVDTVRTNPALRSLRWRLVGPFRGGRVDAVAGDPVHRRVFYFGAVDGGIWKTENAGASWRNVSDGAGISGVGAVAVAPSDPNVIYVGGGESNPREDLTYGDGVYRSTDGGRTWRHMGLEATRHIADVVVDPRDPNTLLVAALGHAFGPNPERGVYRSTDGGATWQKVLFVNDSTGAIDLSLDPTNPRIAYAALWKFQRFPWGFSGGGGRSGIWKTTDGGATWTELTGNPGIPDGPLGRIGLAVSPANPDRIWASIEARDSTGGIFRSDDAGKSWKRVNADQEFMVRPWYFSAVTADPKDPNTVYVLNLGTWRSIDGGRTFQRIRVPHGDCHILWIDLNDPDRMIEGNDGGATISLDGGASWSTLYNQPTAQFYHVITDDQFPYRIYGSQQDNTTVSIASRAPDGAIDQEDWHPVGGGESGYVAPKPGAPDTVFGGTYMGTMSRWAKNTQEERDVSVWLNNYDGYTAAEVPYRFQWTFPIVFSPHDRNTLYVTSQYVHRSTDAGQSWQKISPDLTLHDAATMGPVGGPVTLDMTGTEWYATVFAFAESPAQAGVLWAGSDDGLIHVSRDAGGTWQNVTPKDLPKYTRISIIEPSRHDAGTVYVAANRYQLDDFRPYLYRSRDYGKSWTRIDRGIPAGAYTRAIREDPKTPGLLFAGTETGVYVSFDDGGSWESLQLNLPRASVRDLAIHDDDLVVGTHGRAFWVLDDIEPLRHWAEVARAGKVALLPPAPAIRYLGAGRRRVRNAAENPPNGVIVDYYLPDRPAGAVKLEFLDPTETVIRSFSSRAPAAGASDTTGARGAALDTLAASERARIEAERDSLAFAPSDSLVQTRPGYNRFTWDLRYPDAREVEGIITDVGTAAGPTALPGTYTVRLTVGGMSQTQPFTVLEDPRTGVPPEDLKAQFDLVAKIRDAINDVADGVKRIESLEDQLDGWTARAGDQPYAARVDSAAALVRDSLEDVRGQLVCVHCHADEITLAYPIRIYNKLLSLNLQVVPSHTRPTVAEAQVYDELRGDLDRQLGRLDAIEKGPLADFNALIEELKLTPVSGTR